MFKCIVFPGEFSTFTSHSFPLFPSHHCRLIQGRQFRQAGYVRPSVVGGARSWLVVELVMGSDDGGSEVGFFTFPLPPWVRGPCWGPHCLRPSLSFFRSFSPPVGLASAFPFLPSPWGGFVLPLLLSSPFGWGGAPCWAPPCVGLPWGLGSMLRVS